jgi:signal transduction histidine kinase
MLTKAENRLHHSMDYTINYRALTRRSRLIPAIFLRTLSLGPETLASHIGASLLVVLCILWTGCHAQPPAGAVVTPAIEFTEVPLAAAGSPQKLSSIKGRVIGTRSGQQVVLYAKAGTTWWVQPLTNEPFTKIQADSKWSNFTHPGTDYAALLVGSDFQPPLKTDELPTAGVVAVAVVHGELVFWQRWWFPFVCVIAVIFAVFGYHRLRLQQTTKRLSVRFDERLAERMRVAQELHDTFLQGVLSASMQLHIAVEQIAADSPSRPALNHVIRLMEQVAEEGRNTLQGLRSSVGSAQDLEHSFSRVPQELSLPRRIGFRIIVEGPALPLQPAVRNDVYRIGREALINAFRHSGASKVELELEYAVDQLRVLVRDNGRGIDPELLRSANGRGWGLGGMRQRAEGIGGRLKVTSAVACGTEVELSIPSSLAFESYRLHRASKWLMALSPRDEEASNAEPEKSKTK